MKVLFVESKYKKKDFVLKSDEIKKLPKKIILAYSIQYQDLAEQIKKQLENNKIQIKDFIQVLGCSRLDSQLPIFLIGSGRFHALNLYLQAPEIFLLETEKIIKIPDSEIENLRKKRNIALANFYSAKRIGILVSTKPGQENLKIADKLKKDLQKKDKECYIFVSNNIDLSQFENFKIDSWINTACSGLIWDNPKILNFFEIPIV